MSRIKDVSGTTQRDRAYELLRRAVTLQQLRAGQRLRETEWAGRLNVNRTALREACGRLCAEGLLMEGPKTGYFVAQLSPEELADALEVRLLLEAGAIERICRHGSNRLRDLQPLQKACDELEWLGRNGYHADAAESDQRFHEALVTASGSRRLARVYRCVAPGPWAAAAAEQECPSDECTTLQEHRDILAAIQKGRTTEAQRLLRSHLVGRRAAAQENDVGVA